MNFSADRAWADMVATIKTHREIILTVIGVFVFLPAFAWVLLIPQPQFKADDPNLFPQVMAWWNSVAPWFLLRSLLEMVGTATLLAMLLRPDRPTVTVGLGRAARLLPLLLLTNLLVGLLQFGAFLCFVIPALYLIGRTAMANAALIAEDKTNPVRAIGRSFELTDGNGWRIAATFLLIIIVTGIVSLAATSVFGSLFALVLPVALAVPLNALLAAAMASVLDIAGLLFVVATYRQLAVRPAGAKIGM